MSDILCSTGDFSGKKIAIEMPPIAGLQFASFFGNGTFGATDGQNLVSGGTTFANVGSGPAVHSNYITTSATTGSLNLGMTDSLPAWTLIAAAAPVALGGAMLFGYLNPSNPDPGIAFFNNGLVLQAGIATFGAGTLIMSGTAPIYPAFHLYAFVSVVGKPFAMYDLTLGTQALSGSNVAATGRPGASVQWELGCTTPPSGFGGQSNVAFALGAKSELLLTDLNNVRDALRYPLTARLITV